ncbi:MAG: ATP-binding protein, partial [Chloroflexota bacterium]
ANRAKSAFLATMSHELRTPLNAILGYAQILQQQALDANVLHQLNIVRESGQHLLTLINNILDIAKIEAGKLELYPTPIHLPTFLESIADIIRARAEVKNLQFVFAAADTLPSGVQADETRLRQVLLNLLGNAVKFTNAGQVTLRVKAEGGRRKDERAITQQLHPSSFILLTFEITDTGIGIAVNQWERIFQPFEQAAEGSHSIEGTGLGLPITRQLVQLMGGELHLQSEPGRGSTFWFEIALPRVEAVKKPAQPATLIITGYKGPRRKVLVVDDIPSHQAILVNLLEAVGFEVLEATDGQEAIHVARATQPDLILMDRWMPVLDGFAAARQMRQNPALRAVPIIAVSAGVSAEDQALSREMGIDDFLPKPVHWPRLVALLEQHLELEWKYAEKDKSRRSRLKDELLLQPSKLTPPPHEELVVLLDLALRGNMRAIRERAEHINRLDRRYGPFAHQLRRLAGSFADREILALLEKHLNQR